MTEPRFNARRLRSLLESYLADHATLAFSKDGLVTWIFPHHQGTPIQLRLEEDMCLVIAGFSFRLTIAAGDSGSEWMIFDCIEAIIEGKASEYYDFTNNYLGGERSDGEAGGGGSRGEIGAGNGGRPPHGLSTGSPHGRRSRHVQSVPRRMCSGVINSDLSIQWVVRKAGRTASTGECSDTKPSSRDSLSARSGRWCLSMTARCMGIGWARDL